MHTASHLIGKRVNTEPIDALFRAGVRGEEEETRKPLKDHDD